jgi:hypothetical protein
MAANACLACEPSADVDNRSRSPLATARRRKPAIVDGLGDGVGALASELGQDLAELLRAGVGLPAPRLNALLPRLGGKGLGTVRVAQPQQWRALRSATDLVRRQVAVVPQIRLQCPVAERTTTTSHGIHDVG